MRPNSNTKMKALTISVAAAGIFSGCVSDHQLRYDKANRTTDQLVGENAAYQAFKKQTAPQEKRIKINVREKWIYSLLKKVSKEYHIPLDSSFIPSKEYKVSAKGMYSFREVLEMIARQTGVNYKIEDGILAVSNKSVVEEYERAVRCTKGNTFSISLKNAPVERVFAGLVKEGYNVIYDPKYYNLNGQRPDLKKFPPVNFYYKGCSQKEAVRSFAKTNDLDVAFRGKDVYVRDYKTIDVNIPAPFKSTYASDSSRIGDTEANTGLRLEDRSDPETEMKNLIQSSMSPKGKAYLSEKGYIIVTDTPNSIKRIKKYIKKELEAQQNIELEITIISVELSDAYSSGVDWSALFSSLGEQLGVRNLTMGISAPLTESGGAFTLGGIINNKQQLLQLLGQYGKSKVVKSYRINARSGTITSLKSVDVIPYVTTETIISNGVSQTNDTAESTESGIVLNIKPTYDRGYVNMNIDASLSQYLGDKEVKTGYMLPMQTDNKVQTVIKTKIGSTAILTGLKLKSKKLDYKGLPNVQDMQLSTLTGENSDEVESKEYLIFISPKRIYR